MRKNYTKVAILSVVAAAFAACSSPKASYNEGINVIPVTQSMSVAPSGTFTLSSSTTLSAQGDEAKTVAEFFAAKMGLSTGYDLAVVEGAASIELSINPELDTKAEGYTLQSTADKVTVVGKDAAGLFYGMQTLLQLLPAEIASLEPVSGVEWSLPCVEVKDEPRFGYRGIMLDVCRHFMPVEFVKKQLDILSMFKINRMHWHLTEDQAWRVEIKKYPKLTEIGSKRIEGEGFEYSGFYTQEQIKEVVAYAAERFITIVPEFELPGHELAAIAAYPELSCTGEPTTPRIIWGVEDVVMCPGKPITFEFIEDVIEELVPLFPGEYFHVGGDECPKTSWKKCPRCQAFIKKNGLQAKDGHSAEERLQSYVIGRAEEMLAARGKKLIGWDEILEGGLSPNATVMSWRGEDGGIAAAEMGHNVIMTPNSQGLYIDHYQGDYMIEPVAIGGYAPLAKPYSYDPVPAKLVELGKADKVLGVQANLWTEYMYTNELMEYRLYPRAMAVAEIGWSEVSRKNFDDFARRINNAYVRLDAYEVNYHIPQPEQPNGSTDFIAFVDSAKVEFTTSRPITVVYTTDGSEPTPTSTQYTEPFSFTEDAQLKIRSVLPSGKMSPVREITIQKQAYAPAAEVESPKAGLMMTITPGKYLNREALVAGSSDVSKREIKNLGEIVIREGWASSLRDTKQAAHAAEGYIMIPEDGVYHFWTNNNDLWIGEDLIVDNNNEVKRFSRNSQSVALAKGLHPIKVLWLGNIIGGWPSNWDGGEVKIRKEGSSEWKNVTPDQLYY